MRSVRVLQPATPTSVFPLDAVIRAVALSVR